MTRRKRHNVFIADFAYKPEFRPTTRAIGGETPVWLRQVLATSREDAVHQCLPEIVREFPKLDPTRKYVSVFCGLIWHYGSGMTAGRLMPIQVEIATGQIRR